MAACVGSSVLQGDAAAPRPPRSSKRKKCTWEVAAQLLGLGDASRTSASSGGGLAATETSPQATRGHPAALGLPWQQQVLGEPPGPRPQPGARRSRPALGDVAVFLPM